jgi:hypothetical protein
MLVFGKTWNTIEFGKYVTPVWILELHYQTRYDAMHSRVSIGLLRWWLDFTYKPWFTLAKDFFWWTFHLEYEHAKRCKKHHEFALAFWRWTYEGAI